MSEEKQIFLAPCSREHKSKTYEHFESTVLDGVGTDTHPKIKSTGFDGTVSVWGVVSGNDVYWQKLNSGDIVLFYTKSGVYTHLAEVIDTEYDELVGDQWWTTYDGKRLVNDLEEPWPYLIYLSNVQQVNIPAEDVHNALGYDMDYPQGFIRPTEDRHQKLRESFGSVQDFVQRYTNAPLSGPVRSVEEIIEDLNSRLNREPEFKTTAKRTQQNRLYDRAHFAGG